IGQLGLQAVDRGGAMRAFRMDDRKQRLIVDGGLTNGERFFGWEVADATALDALAARLENAGVAVRRGIARRAGPPLRRWGDFLPRSGRQPCGGVPRWSDRR